ncbi:molecular chaperone [Ramlibacter ginsenosidimutans]|uniref:Molecular chaperone n=1 Tax=Ramlibacter ginsenosidimutans TaxID=502333 RepID=A0A934TQ70_9BURK|nr:fimbria/pilus periplasmic chaperone [Ramlibacter ginsenosidimutans]MBK6005278.1 molecular chaperone [Ramlibacter ginsenosidimutans]
MTRTSTSRRVLFLLAACVAAATAHPALAGSFSVSPVRIFMEARERATGVTIINEGDTDLVMQAELFEWKQKPDGTDDLLPTQDLVLAPPILKLGRGARQTVRLANLRPPVPGEQLTYRLIVREVPEALAPKDGVKIQVALAFSLPIFITPPGAKREMACTATRTSPTALRASCENKGHAYAQPASITLSTPSGNTLLTSEIRGGYILPGVSRNFDLSSDGSRIPGGPLKLQVTQDDGSKQVFDVRLPE